jgi:hypothetical protein
VAERVAALTTEEREQLIFSHRGTSPAGARAQKPRTRTCCSCSTRSPREFARRYLPTATDVTLMVHNSARMAARHCTSCC